MLKKLIFLFVVAAGLTNIAASSSFVVWKEEVKLSDGRVIAVEQKKRTEGPVARESWLTINLPEFSSQPIVWHENLLPLIVNIDEGLLYIVGLPQTDIESNKYGLNKPPYVGYVLEKGEFIRIPFEKIPVRIYNVNMLLYDFPPEGTKLLTIEMKASKKLNGDLKLQHLWKLNPNMGCFC